LIKKDMTTQYGKGRKRSFKRAVEYRLRQAVSALLIFSMVAGGANVQMLTAYADALESASSVETLVSDQERRTGAESLNDSAGSGAGSAGSENTSGSENSTDSSSHGTSGGSESHDGSSEGSSHESGSAGGEYQSSQEGSSSSEGAGSSGTESGSEGYGSTEGSAEHSGSGAASSEGGSSEGSGIGTGSEGNAGQGSGHSEAAAGGNESGDAGTGSGSAGGGSDAGTISADDGSGMGGTAEGSVSGPGEEGSSESGAAGVGGGGETAGSGTPDAVQTEVPAEAAELQEVLEIDPELEISAALSEREDRLYQNIRAEIVGGDAFDDDTYDEEEGIEPEIRVIGRLPEGAYAVAYREDPEAVDGLEGEQFALESYDITIYDKTDTSYDVLPDEPLMVEIITPRISRAAELDAPLYAWYQSGKDEMPEKVIRADRTLDKDSFFSETADGDFIDLTDLIRSSIEAQAAEEEISWEELGYAVYSRDKLKGKTASPSDYEEDDEPGDVTDAAGIIDAESSEIVSRIEESLDKIRLSKDAYHFEYSAFGIYSIATDDARLLPLTEQKLEAVIYTGEDYSEESSEETTITLTGLLPTEGTVRAYPVELDVADGIVLAAYDISIFRADGTLWEPKEENEILVEIDTPALREAMAEDRQFGVLHVTEGTDLATAEIIPISNALSAEETLEKYAQLQAAAEEESLRSSTAAMSRRQEAETEELVSTLSISETLTVESISDPGLAIRDKKLAKTALGAVVSGSLQKMNAAAPTTAGTAVSEFIEDSSEGIKNTPASGRIDIEAMYRGHEKMEDLPPSVSDALDQAVFIKEAPIGFYAKTFSVYAIIETTLTKTVTASDGNTYKITVTFMEDAGFPGRTELDVAELSGEAYADYVGRAAAAMNAAGFAYARVFDISIVDEEGNRLQPSAPVDVVVELLDAKEPEDRFSVVHFAVDPEGSDQNEQTVLMEAETEANTVIFSTDGFSAYAIVTGPSSIPIGWHTISSIDELIEKGTEGLYIGHPDGYYYGNTTTGDSSRTGIIKTKPAQSYPAAAAAKYYFELVGGQTNQVYAYCYAADGTTKQYVYNGGNNSLSFTTDESDMTAFTVTRNSNGTFKLNNGSWYWNMQGGTSGTRFCSYNNSNDPNNYVYFWYYVDAPHDPYELNGKSYGLINWNGSVMGRAMMADSANPDALDAKSLIVMSTSNNSSQRFVVPNDSDISMWSFTWAEDDKYYLSCGAQYLKIEGTGLTLVSDQSSASKIQVIPGTGTRAGQICLKAGDTTLTYSGSVETGFSVGGITGSEWLYLTGLSELTSDYFMTYSASKVSVSDTTSVTNGSKIIVYTRAWNDAMKAYEFYVVDSDGSLVPCAENGDSIQWVGGLLNTKLWNFVEYYWEGTNTPNYYYELYNQYSGKFIAPQVSGGQILSDSTIGINLDGRKKGYYYSSIVAWDDGYYAYAGLKADLTTGKIVSCSLSEADDFYFAIVQDLPVDDALTTLPTVDHTQYGITIKIKDFNATGTEIAKNPMSAFLGSDAGGAVNYTQPGLLSTDLGTNGYPTNNSGESLLTQYAGAQEVNHLFIGSTYSGSGYFEYDSTQNFASLDTSTGDFTVYKEIATYDGSNKNTLKHGQFLPFNNIEAGVFASVNGKNLYSATAQLLPDSDPRKYEQLYLVKNVNLYFAVDIEASFTQTANGLDAWGHDIIYEFTGDDDFWLYVDGELVIDLGGIHSALPGSVNYSTGEVNVNGTHTTLRAIFESNYLLRHPEATEEEVAAFLAEYFDEGSTIFKDYTTHTMRIFYMERGGGASNLHMRFNLASVRPGHVLLTKELAGIDEDETVMAEFPYQIWYKLENEEEHRLSNHDPLNIKVYYKDTVTPVTYKQSLSVGGNSYADVFILKPGEIADIAIPDDAISYRIVECGVNTDVYGSVTVNEDADLTQTDTSVSNRKDYALNYKTTRDRPRVTYVNTVKPKALRNLTIQKVLYKEDGETVIQDDDTQFSFRLYLASEFDGDLNDSAAYMHSYHVKDRNGNYCRWDVTDQCLVSLGKTDYSELSPAEKAQTTFHTSMNGSISRIPGGYTVEIREVLAGTRYRVEERPGEIPDGYSFQKYEYNNSASEIDRSGVLGVVGTVVADVDPYVNICNLRGWGLRVNKVWSDADYMRSRAATYFAVYTNDGSENLTIVPSTAIVKDENGAATTIVRQLPYGKTSIYWYFPSLPVSETALGNYVIREVTLTGSYLVDEAGNVTLGSDAAVTPVGAGEHLTFTGTQKGESEEGSYEYTVIYQRGDVPSGSQVRVDTVGNNRPGILLKKTDWAGNPLQGASFELKKGDEPLGTFVSGTDGVITTAFLSNDSAEYTLTETTAPQGYQAIPTAITLSQTAGTVKVSGPDGAYYTLDQGAGTEASLTIKNRSYTFSAIKVNADTDDPISGVSFALHKQVTVGDVTSYDLNPMPGYETLTTGADGVIPRIDDTLPAGHYELREKETPGGYQPLTGYIHFAVSSTGVITLETHPDASLDSSVDSINGKVTYFMTVSNHPKLNLRITKTVTGEAADLNKNFTLTISSTAITESSYAVTGTGSSTISAIPASGTASGSIILTVKHGDDITISGLGRGNYTITESPGAVLTAKSSKISETEPVTPVDITVHDNSMDIELNENTKLDLFNEMKPVTPTGYTSRKRAFGRLLLMSLLLGSMAALPVWYRKRRNGGGDDEM